MAGDRPLAAIPIRSFDNAKTRLAEAMSRTGRSRLGRALAARTAWIARDAGAEVVVIAGSDAAAAWSEAAGFASIVQPPDAPGLDGAAAVGIEVAVAQGRRGFVLHADLPWLTAAALRRVFHVEGPVIAPSHDGGTSLIGNITAAFPFAYGPGSFHRHLAAMPDATVIVTPPLALDLDQPADLTRALRCCAGGWLHRYALKPEDSGLRADA